MAVQAQLYSENLGFPLGMDNNVCGFNEFYVNLPQKQTFIQQDQFQNLNQNNSISLPKTHQSMAFSRNLASQIEKQRQEIDIYITLQNERLRLALQEQRKQQLEVLLKKFEAKTNLILKQKEEEMAKAVQRRMELEEFLRRMEIENQTWQRVAKENEAIALNLNGTIEHLKENACLANGFEDAESCCDEMMNNRGGTEEQTGENRGGHECELENGERNLRKMVCKGCNSQRSCVVFLPCRHLCSCKACEAFLVSCPVCGGAKRASIEALI
ncbi:probable BOI-related E3 ubiquitin-protein ligase 2 [Cornus florida]|uniref:probable BOI-related E3 ubiquitin-protein ligase 2 n=1 Tax=Cornus florida TaxID=4283 RepID=UPI0028A24ABD|nr:probable BOI-related E3 ubiquitin-protein ligase 2 [Cornus florida]